jgi:hypothetical protein
MVRETTHASVTGASKEKEMALAVEKEVEPLKVATRIPAMEASKEGDATPVLTAKMKDKGKEKSPSPGQADPKV